MSNKLSKEQIEVLNGLGIVGNTEEEVRPLLIKGLKDQQIEDIDEDPLEDLITIYQAFVKPSDIAPLKEVASEEDEDEKDLQDLKKEAKEKPKPVAKKAAEKSFAKNPDGSPKNPEKLVKATTKNSGDQYDGNNPEHVERLKKELSFIEELGDLKISFKSSCVPVTLKNSDGGRSIITIESIRFRGDETIYKVVYNGLNLFKNSGSLLEIMYPVIPEDYQDALVVMQDNQYPQFRNINLQTLKAVVNKELFDMIAERMKKFDKKLKSNREKMEQFVENKKD